MKAAIYIRVSTEDQAIHGHSLPAQQDECVKYLLRRGYTEYEVYADDGYSAKTMNRPALTRMLQDVNAKKINYIVFWALDRLTRDPIDGLIMCRETFYKKGIDFASIMEELDIKSADGEMMLTIRLAMARAERRRISERTKLGYIKRANSGKRNTPSRPYGYHLGPDLTLTPNEEEIPILHMIYDWYIEGKGVHKIVRELNLRNIPSSRGGVWTRSPIMSMLQNITYIGYNHWKPKEAPEEQRVIKKGTHQPLIDKEKFDYVQSLIKRRATGDMSSSSYTFYFSSILKCASCGYSFYGNSHIQKSGRRQIQYYCQGKRQLGVCNISTVSERKVTRLVLAQIRTFMDEAKNVRKEVASTSDGTDKERKRVLKEITTKNAEMEKLLKLYLADKVDLQTYEKEREEIKNRVSELEGRLSDLPMTTTASGQLTYAATVRLLENLLENWEYLNDLERKRLIQSLYSSIKIAKIDKVWRIEEMTLALQ
ncbi:recombinase family protein [Paenibacillus periandrae]|uniref:recombinase family protein n=1 Tax=Paenibacillus periandrae TaxID=1761741 RepID=UPI001F0993BE|nr:recombinase family protein [Paenibacillus periandrae]